VFCSVMYIFLGALYNMYMYSFTFRWNARVVLEAVNVE
jgi:hypothetical protein